MGFLEGAWILAILANKVCGHDCIYTWAPPKPRKPENLWVLNVVLDRRSASGLRMIKKVGASISSYPTI